MPRENSGLKKRSVRIAGHNTSVTIETPFWSALQHIAQEKCLSLNAIITEIDEQQSAESLNLSSAIRLYILQYYQDKLTE